MPRDHVAPHDTHRRGKAAALLRAVLWGRLWDILKVVLIVLLLKWLVIDIVRIPSPSMEPLLHGNPGRLRGDYVAVNKLAYGLRIPFTAQRIVSWGEVRRWDVVVFRNPEPEADHAVLIKRVVGLPGEEVRIRRGGVRVNGKPLEPPPDLADTLYYMRFPAPSEAATRDMLLSLAQRQSLPYIFDPKNPDFRVLVEDIKRLLPKVEGLELSELSQEERDALVADVRPTSLSFIADWLALQYRLKSNFEYGVHDQPEFTQIPPGHYYLLGDNSRESVDSRAFGWVSRKSLYGRAFAIVLPPSHIRDLSGFTQTWWGPLVLVGVPLLMIVYELLRAFVLTTGRVRRPHDELDLRRGDRILIHRLAYGIRAPFTRTRRRQFRRPQSGDVVAYYQDGHRNFGRVAEPGASANSMEGREFVTIRRDSSFDRVPPGHIDGRVLALVWPWGRRRRFRAERDAPAVPE